MSEKFYKIINGNRVARLVYGTGQDRFIGEVVGYASQPTYIVRNPEGELEHWVESLVHPVDDDVALKYWMQRADTETVEKIIREDKK